MKEDYLIKKEIIMKLRETAYEDIIDIINTDNIYLPKSKVSLFIEEIKQYINEMKKELMLKKNNNNDCILNTSNNDEFIEISESSKIKRVEKSTKKMNLKMNQKKKKNQKKLQKKHQKKY